MESVNGSKKRKGRRSERKKTKTRRDFGKKARPAKIFSKKFCGLKNNPYVCSAKTNGGSVLKRAGNRKRKGVIYRLRFTNTDFKNSPFLLFCKQVFVGVNILARYL